MRPRPPLFKPLGSVRLAPAHLSTSLPSLSFQSLTNCPRFATHSEPSSFQSITNCPICKPFVLITIRNAGGVGGGPDKHLFKKDFNSRIPPPSPLECAVTCHSQVIENTATLSPLECAVTRFRALTPLECALTKKVGGWVRAAFLCETPRADVYPDLVGVPLRYPYSFLPELKTDN
jgi:hypothetical protein